MMIVHGDKYDEMLAGTHHFSTGNKPLHIAGTACVHRFGQGPRVGGGSIGSNGIHQSKSSSSVVARNSMFAAAATAAAAAAAMVRIMSMLPHVPQQFCVCRIGEEQQAHYEESTHGLEKKRFASSNGTRKGKISRSTTGSDEANFFQQRPSWVAPLPPQIARS